MMRISLPYKITQRCHSLSLGHCLTLRKKHIPFSKVRSTLIGTSVPIPLLGLYPVDSCFFSPSSFPLYNSLPLAPFSCPTHIISSLPSGKHFSTSLLLSKPTWLVFTQFSSPPRHLTVHTAHSLWLGKLVWLVLANELWKEVTHHLLRRANVSIKCPCTFSLKEQLTSCSRRYSSKMIKAFVSMT